MKSYQAQLIVLLFTASTYYISTYSLNVFIVFKTSCTFVLCVYIAGCLQQKLNPILDSQSTTQTQVKITATDSTKFIQVRQNGTTVRTFKETTV